MYLNTLVAATLAIISLVTCSPITVRFNSTNNYFEATEVVIDSETFIKGQLYETYQGPVILFEGEQFLIASSHMALLEYFGDKEIGQSIPDAQGVYIKKIIVDLDTCILSTSNKAIDSRISVVDDSVVQGVYIPRVWWSWNKLSKAFSDALTRHTNGSLWPSDLVRGFDKTSPVRTLAKTPQKCSWLPYKSGNVWYTVSVFSSLQECSNGFIHMDGPSERWAALNLPQNGIVRGAILLGNSVHKDWASCVEYYHLDWEDQTTSPCPAHWFGVEKWI